MSLSHSIVFIYQPKGNPMSLINTQVQPFNQGFAGQNLGQRVCLFFISDGALIARKTAKSKL
jgi:hypothetical protein